VGVGVLALLAAGCGGDSETASSVDLSDKSFDIETAASEVEVDALDNQFTPPYIEIRAGTTVIFANQGRNPHNVLPVDEGAFPPIETEAFEPRASESITFDRPGEFPYYCSLHGTTTKGMVGAVRVVE
jgi:plastocyanin